MHFLWQLTKIHLPQVILVQFYTSTIESIMSAFTVWFGAASSKEKGNLQRTSSLLRKSWAAVCHYLKTSVHQQDKEASRKTNQ